MTIATITKTKIVIKESKKFIEPSDLVFGNCINLLEHVKDNSINLIAIDPPYEIGYDNNTWDLKNSLNWETLSKEC